LRAHLAELGIVAAKGDNGVKELLSIVADEKDARLPIDARASVIVLAAQLQAVQTLIGSIEKRIKTQHRSNEASKRLETIPGIGVIGASAIAATVADPTVFRSGRDFAAWIGLVPRQDSTGGKQKLGPISKQSDRYLRRILIVGAISVLRRAGRILGNIPDPRNSLRGGPSRSWWWHLPTRWLAWPGGCWPMAAPIGRLCLRQRRKESGDRRMRFCSCVHELQG
jgi:transposase